MKKLLLLPFVSLLLLSGCKKDDPTKNAKLPEATQEGRNTVGFTLEGGEVWVPYFECGMGQDPYGKYSARVSYPFANQNGIDFLFARSDKKVLSYLTISTALIGTVTSVGEKIDSVGVFFKSESFESYGDLPQPGSRFIITKIDKMNQIISGEFHLILKDKTGKTVTLSNGRFDFKFNACACD
ncbi:hypothetical protein [Nibribacter koreensis]|uniref:Lipoprotein n=1 Tax=Nibribacter koreensis TaxID=1084519 RepID=A0ABP8FYR4_9BACT